MSIRNILVVIIIKVKGQISVLDEPSRYYFTRIRDSNKYKHNV